MGWFDPVGVVARELAVLLEHDLQHAPCVRNDRDRPLLRSRLPEATTPATRARLGEIYDGREPTADW